MNVHAALKEATLMAEPAFDSPICGPVTPAAKLTCTAAEEPTVISFRHCPCDTAA